MTAHFNWFQTAYPALQAAKVGEKENGSVTIDLGNGVRFTGNQPEDFERLRDASTKALEVLKGAPPTP